MDWGSGVGDRRNKVYRVGGEREYWEDQLELGNNLGVRQKPSAKEIP